MLTNKTTYAALEEELDFFLQVNRAYNSKKALKKSESGALETGKDVMTLYGNFHSKEHYIDFVTDIALMLGYLGGIVDGALPDSLRLAFEEYV